MLAEALRFFFSSRRRHTRCLSDWSSDVCSSDLRRAQFEVDWLAEQTPACKYREYGQRLPDSCAEGRCDPSNTNSALTKLKDVAGSYVVLRLRPELGAGALTRSHIDQIMELLLGRTARPTTR